MKQKQKLLAPEHLRSCGLDGGAADGEMRHFTPCALQIVTVPPEQRELTVLDEVTVWSQPDEIPVVVVRRPSERSDMATIACSGYGICRGGTVEVPTADVAERPNSPLLTFALHSICTRTERYFVDDDEIVVISREPLP